MSFHTIPHYTICADARRIAMHSAYLFFYHFFRSHSLALPPHILLCCLCPAYIYLILYFYSQASRANVMCMLFVTLSSAKPIELGKNIIYIDIEYIMNSWHHAHTCPCSSIARVLSSRGGHKHNKNQTERAHSHSRSCSHTPSKYNIELYMLGTLKANRDYVHVCRFTWFGLKCCVFAQSEQQPWLILPRAKANIQYAQTQTLTHMLTYHTELFSFDTQ